MALPTDDDYRAEFHELRAQEAAIKAKAAPIRAEYDAARAQESEFHEKTMKPIIARMKVAEDGLHQIQQRIGRIVRFLRGANGAAATGDAPLPKQ